MKNIVNTKILLLILFFISTLAACGKKGQLEYPKDYKRPNFDNVIDEK